MILFVLQMRVTGTDFSELNMNTDLAMPPKKRMRRAALLLLAIAACVAIGAAIFIPRLNRFQVDGQINLSGPIDEITIKRDEKGMPYVYANSLRDAIFGQGFVTAQDRIFQMQLMRLQAEGRLSELAGDQAKPSDVRSRTIGIARAAKKHAAMLDEASREVFQAYVDGINAFLDQCPGDLPIEFKLAGIQPDRWEIKDSLSILYLMSWDTSANLKHEVLTQMLIDKIGLDRALDLAPININADAPSQPDSASSQTGTHANGSAARQHPIFSPCQWLLADAKLAGLCDSGSLTIGSNNWTTAPAMSSGGKHAIMSGDPHLDPRMLPGIMYAVGFVFPDGRAVGAGPPGIPGFVVGRNEHVALSVTNNYGDVQDLYIETLDPASQANYREGGQSIPFRIEKETLKIKDKSSPDGYRNEEIELRFTSRGPVVSEVLPGLETDKVLTMRWAAVESMQPHLGLADVLTAKSVDEVDTMIQSVTSIVLNFVFADSSGNIGWRASGRIPIRNAESGTLPLLVDADAPWEDNWQGWIPFEEMPHDRNPERGWLGTANHYTVPPDYPYYYSNFAAPSYRYRQLKQRMTEDSDGLSVEEHWQIQRDTKNLMAASVAPALIEGLQADEETAPLADVLKKWDFHDDTDQAGPTVFQAVHREFAKAVYQDELGEQLADAMLGNWYFWQERFEAMVLSGDSPWFDDVSTADVKETIGDMIQRAGKAAIARMAPGLGRDPSTWLWGKVHTIQWVNPIRRSGIGKDWLGTAAHPVAGSGETLYRGWYDYDKPYAVSFAAAVRMVVDFGDSEKVQAILAGGSTARTFHPHQKDQIPAYLSGEPKHWWFSDQAIDSHAVSKLVLVPRKSM